jgi:dUTP pyrophosphatase
MTVDIVNKSTNPLPKYAKLGDAGMDLCANLTNGFNEDFLFGAALDEERNVLLIFSGGRALIPTGLYTAVPEGHELQVRPRSGLALKQGVTVLNTPGTIDTGYRGEIGVVLINFSDDVFEVAQGDRIAQAVLNKFETINWNDVAELPTSERGEGGYGSTGVKL